MSYASGNPATKRELKERVARGDAISTFSPGPFPAKRDGEDTIEGPQYPQPHKWYARVRVEAGIITKVLS